MAGPLGSRSAFAGFAGTSMPTPAPLALASVRIGLAGDILARRLVVGKAFGLFRLDFSLGLEGLVVLEGLFFHRRRERRDLGCEEGLGGLQRVHLIAAVD